MMNQINRDCKCGVEPNLSESSRARPELRDTLKKDLKAMQMKEEWI